MERTMIIDLKELSYCGLPCKQCGLLKATLENDAATKKELFEQWGTKEKFGIEFDAETFFCYTCKPGDKPKKIGMDTCEVRKCALSKELEACVLCDELKSCDKEFWKAWPETHGFVKKLQERFADQPGATRIEIKVDDQST